MQKRFLDTSYALSDSDATRQHYDDWADSYDEELTSNAYSQPLRCAQALEASGLSKDARILDVGCGTGLAAVAAKQSGYQQVDGCDFSVGMLKKARSTQLYTRLFEADLNHPPLDVVDNHYDAALVVGVFSFGHVQATAMEDIVRVVSANAPIIVGINDKFYKEGSLPQKLRQMQSEKRLLIEREEMGEHLPGIGLSGWVFSLRKC